jgi:hypothetical protein
VPREPPDDSVRYVPLTRGKFAIVDAVDYERVSGYKWCASGSGDRWYAVREAEPAQQSSQGQELTPQRCLPAETLAQVAR